MALGCANQLQCDRLRRAGGTVFTGQDQAIVLARQIGVGIAEGMQIRAATQGLSRLDAVLFAGVVDQHDGG